MGRLGIGNMKKSIYDPDSNGMVDHADLENILASQHHAKTQNIPAWELIGSYEDTNTGTAFDYDSGVLGTIYNLYLIIIQVQDFIGTGINNLAIQVNNDATSNYEFTFIDTTGAGSRVTGNSQGIIAEMRQSENASVMALVRGGNKAGNPARDYPTFGTFGGNSGTTFIRGSLQVDYADVNQIHIYSLGPNATGRLKIYGLNL